MVYLAHKLTYSEGIILANNVKVKEVSIMLDKPRKIIFDFNAFVDLEDIYGTIEEAMKVLGEKKIRTLRQFLWIALKQDDETLTEMQVGKMLSLVDMGIITEKLTEAVSTGLPDEKPKKN
jgi:hypothetical protein